MKVAVPLYSPHPPEAYSRGEGDERAGIGYQLRALDKRALWNLYWLSEPRLDEFLEGGPFGLIDFKLFRACMSTLEQKVDGVLLAEMLDRCNAAQFVDHLEMAARLDRAGFDDLETTRLLGGQRWLSTARARAKQFRGFVSSDGSVIQGAFGRAPTRKMTTSQESATIMPLAFTKN